MEHIDKDSLSRFMLETNELLNEARTNLKIIGRKLETFRFFLTEGQCQSNAEEDSVCNGTCDTCKDEVPF